MRSLKEVYPEFAESVNFYAITVDPFDDAESLERFRENEGYPWPLARTESDLLFKLHVTQQSTKVAFGSDGIIIYREKMGGGDAETWRKILQQLSGV